MNAPALRLVPSDAEIEDVRFAANDRHLSGRVFRPGGQPRAVVVIHAATGVPMGYYRAFAKWLMSQDLACFTYDYSGIAMSTSEPMRQSRATMVDWALADQPAAQAEAERLFPGGPVWVIGHSIGGAMLPFQPAAAQISRVITVCSGPVHLTDHPWPYRAAAAMFWYGLGPFAVAALGYLPGRLFGRGPDIPAGVYWQWRRWCTTRGFYIGDIGRNLPVPDWKAITCPIKLVAVADDLMMPPAAVWRLMAHYPEARKTQLVLHPESGQGIGHMGAFHPRNAHHWPEIIA